MERETTDEERGKVVKAVEQNEVLLEMGYYGVPAMELVERTKKAKEMMRNAICCLIQARMSFQILRVGDGNEKEKHLMALMEAEEFFTEKYRNVFGELETVMMVPKG